MVNVRQTSKKGYREALEDIQAQKAKIMAIILEGGAMTNNELSRIMNLPPGRISARTSHLKSQGKLIEVGKKLDPITKCEGYLMNISKVQL